MLGEAQVGIAEVGLSELRKACCFAEVKPVEIINLSTAITISYKYFYCLLILKTSHYDFVVLNYNHTNIHCGRLAAVVQQYFGVYISIHLGFDFEPHHFDCTTRVVDVLHAENYFVRYAD